MNLISLLVPLIMLTLLLTIFLAIRFHRLKISNKIQQIMIMELKIEELLTEIIASTDAVRVVLVRAHNGGSEILLGADKKISILIEPEISLQPFTKNDYQCYPIDNHYKKLLVNSMERNFLFSSKKEIPPGMMQRKIDADDIAETIHFRLGKSNESYYFLFVGARSTNQIIGDVRQFNYIELRVEKLRQIVENAIAQKFLL